MSFEALAPGLEPDLSKAAEESGLMISVVVMAYNEVGTAVNFVDEVRAELNSLGVSWELLAVDDCSTDGTREALLRAADRIAEMRVVSHASNLGLGAVYRTGLREAAGAFITFFPADAQFPASNLSVLWKAAADQDAVFGYLEDRRDGWAAVALSSIERMLYRIIVGPLPRFQGVLMVRRGILSDFSLVSSGRGWGILMELAARLHQGSYRSQSVLTTIVPRRSGESKVRNLRTIMANMRDLLLLRFALSRKPYPL